MVRRPIQGSYLQSELTGDAKRATYNAYYATLADLREEFHREGRFDDANIKLDEITKLLLMRMHEIRRGRDGEEDRFTKEYLHRLSVERFGNTGQVARALRALSEEILSDSSYMNPDGTSIFGHSPFLSIQPTEDMFATRIIATVKALSPHFDSVHHSLIDDFDILNESFGHFVRDTFHQTKQDAQYMTPTEAVAAMVAMAFSDISKNPREVERVFEQDGNDPYIVLDPTCGVGSFLVEALRHMLKLAEERGLTGREIAALAERLSRHTIYGQDKVDRMVRLAKVNLLLFGGNGNSINQGNSVTGSSTLDALEGKVDLILTNPPSGQNTMQPICSLLARDIVTHC